MVKEDILDDASIFFLKEQIEVERQIINLMDTVLAKVENPGLKLLLYRYKLDSMKHEALCQGLIDVISKPTLSPDEIEVSSLKAIAEEHHRLEEGALNNIRKLIKKVKNKNVKVLLKELEADEKLHHKSLDSLIPMLKLPEEIHFWDILKAL